MSYYDGIPLYNDANKYFLYIKIPYCVSMGVNCDVYDGRCKYSRFFFPTH